MIESAINSVGESGDVSASGSEVVADPPVQWRAPFTFLRSARRELAKDMAWIALRVTGYVLLLGLAFQWIVTAYLPALPVRVINVAWCVMGVTSLLMWLSAASLMRPTKGRLYRATEDGIEGAGRDGNTQKWKFVKAFAVEENEECPGVRILALYTSMAHPRRIALPEGESANAVIAAVQKRVKPLAECPNVAAEFAKPLIPLTMPLIFAMLLATTIGSVAAGSCGMS